MNLEGVGRPPAGPLCQLLIRGLRARHHAFIKPKVFLKHKLPSCNKQPPSCNKSILNLVPEKKCAQNVRGCQGHDLVSQKLF